ncbi:hypothetical protein TCAL_14262 [Tigriopus californicus]|uniref:Uncharacterized protein n=1 Tax=Tigriopus californicus TaxID=6832 RepID=A0A553NV34_TIGCA|nr:hypothetical protein TCAL_14262 [Tigriopus californicus]
MSNRMFLICFFMFRMLLSSHIVYKHLLSCQYVARDLPEVLDLIDRLGDAIKSAKSTIENCSQFDQATTRHDCESQNSLTRLMVSDWESKANLAQVDFRKIETAVEDLLENTWYSSVATLHFALILWGVYARKVMILQYALLSPMCSLVLKDVGHGNLVFVNSFRWDFLLNLPVMEHSEVQIVALTLVQHFIEDSDPILGQTILWCFMSYVYYSIFLESTGIVISKPKTSKTTDGITFSPTIKSAPNDSTLFLHSCLYNLKSQVKFFIQSRGFKINVQDELNGNTGIHLAVLIGSVPLVQLLLGNKLHKVDVTLKNKDGMTALQLALLSERPLMAQLIMKSNHFKVNSVKDMDSLVLTAVQAEKWNVALDFVENRPDYQFRCHFLKAMLERCCCLSKELLLPRKAPQSIIIRKIQNIRIYKEEIIASLRKSDLPMNVEALERQTEELPKQLQVVKDIFECYVCFNPMFQVQIYACSNDHWMCENCHASPSIRECPMCKECFQKQPPKRCLTAEKIAHTISIQ